MVAEHLAFLKCKKVDLYRKNGMILLIFTNPYYMVFKKALIILLLHIIVTQLVYGDVTKDDINRAIIKSKLKHPYLYFTGEDKPSIFERIKNDPACHNLYMRQLAEANRSFYAPVDPEPPARNRMIRYDPDNNDYDRYISKNTARAFNLALIYQMTGDEEYAKKAFEFIEIVCDLPTWIHPACEFPIMYNRVWTWGAKDDQVVFSYGQHTDYAVFQIAAIYDWLYPALSVSQRDRIRGALLEKAILRVRGNYEYHWWATSYRCNWCAVCNSSIGVAATALLTEDPQLVDVIAESYNRIGKTLDEIHDGGWQEGMGYLRYTIITSMQFADVLKRITGGTLNLYTHPRFEDAVNTFLYCQIPPDKSVHFGDSGSGNIGSYSLYNELMLETGNRKAAWLRKHTTHDQPSSVYDFFKPRSQLEPSLPETASIHFPVVEWVIMRSDFNDPEKVVIAGKCGKNDDPHHGHLDVGHFGLYWRGQEFICDNGSAGYDKAYFDDERWEYPLAATIGHNTVMVNGEQQVSAKRKNQPWNYDIGGSVVEFRTGSDRDYALMDPTDAYQGKELINWRRHIVLEKPVITVLLDEIRTDTGAEIEVRFHSSANQVVQKDHVLLNGDKGTMAVIPITYGEYELRPGNHVILMAQKNARMRLVPYFGTVVKAKSSTTIIGTIILPVEDEREVQEITASVKRTIDSSGKYLLSFTSDGKTYSYDFTREKDGIVLVK